MRCLFIVWLCIVLCFKTNAQQKLSFNQDSLLKVVKSNATEKQKIQALQELSDHWLYIDSAKSMQYAQDAFSRGVNTNDPLTIAIARYYVAGVYMEHFNLAKAKIEFQKAVALLKLDTTYTAQRYLARTWHNIGAIYQREDNTEEFLKILIEKACPILEHIGDSLLLAGNYYDIGNVFCDIRQYDKAFSYFQKAADIFSKHKEYAQAVESHLGKVKALLYQEDFSSLNKKKMEDDLAFSFQLLEKHPEAYPWMGYYTLLGMFQQYVNEDYEAALDSYDKGLLFASKRQEPYNQIELLNRKYYLFYDQKQYTKAKAVAYSVYKENGKYPISRNKLISLKNLVNVEEALGNRDKAFVLLKQYVELADTVNKKQTNVKLNLIEQKYEHEKKEREIAALKAENQLKSVELKYNRVVLTVAVLVLVLLLILLLLGYLLYRNKQKLAKQEKELHQEQIERLRKEQQINFFNAMIQGQEQERKRLASDLHDGLGGLLSNIKLLLSKNPCIGESREAQQQHQTILTKLDAAVNELRRIARNMMPETLLRFGLITALRDFCEDLERSGVKISLQTYGFSPNDDKDQQIMIYRILQELINNAVRHASAKTILVQCIQNEEKVFITVEDDGEGFNLGELEEQKGIGLHNVKNRVNYLNGQLDIQSERHVGTTINIEFNLTSEINRQPVLT